jgi:predicted acyl esterase
VAAEGRRGGADRPGAAGGTRALYLREGGGLAFAAPPATPNTPDSAAADRYVSDPADPVPYRRRPIGATFGDGQQGWWTWLAEDQRFVAGRPDVLRWQTPPLDEDVTVSGDVVARLFASTTGGDADWVVKLVDVYPDSGAPALGADSALAGYQLMVAATSSAGASAAASSARCRCARRGRAVRADAARRRPHLPPRPPDHGPGPEQLVPALRPATRRRSCPTSSRRRPRDFRAATHRVYRSARHPSRVELPVVGRGRHEGGSRRSDAAPTADRPNGTHTPAPPPA